MKKAFSLTALFFLMLSINAQVNQEWAQTYNPGANNAMALDNSGNIYATGSSGSTMLLQKYDAAGNLLWTQTIIPGSTTGVAYAVAVDGNGDVIITGRGNVGFTIKYDANGQLLWSVTTNFYSNSLAIDENNNIYIRGQVSNTLQTVKYNSAGVQQWVATSNFDPANNGTTLNDKRIVYKNGFVYETGQTFVSLPGSPNTRAILTLKYNASNGAQVWAATYTHSDKISQYGIDLTVDGSGNVYATGIVYNKAGKNQNQNWVTLKYNSSGTQQWAAIYDGNGNDYLNNSTSVGLDYPSAVTLDNAGNIIVSGTSYTTTGQFTSQDMTTVKYNPSGTQSWVKNYDGTGHENDFSYAVASDASSNIYITGQSGVSNGNATTIKYNSSGVQQWLMNYDGGATTIDRGNAICVDNSANVYAAGRTGYSSLLIKYSQAAPLVNPVTASPQSSSQATSANELLISNFEMTAGLGCDAIGTSTDGVVYLPLQQLITISEFTHLSTKFYTTSDRVIIQFTFNGPNNNPVDIYYYETTIPNQWNETGNLLSTFSWIETNNGPYYSWNEFLAEGYGAFLITSAKMIVYADPPGSYVKIDDTRFNDLLLNYDDCDNDNVIDYIDCDPSNPQNQKIKICHNGNTICVALSAVQAHLNHGDYLGACATTSLVSKGIVAESNKEPDAFVYPNPASGQVTVRNEFNKPLGNITIYNANGIVMCTRYSGKAQVSIDINNLPSGIYFIRSDQMKETLRFVKQ